MWPCQFASRQPSCAGRLINLVQPCVPASVLGQCGHAYTAYEALHLQHPVYGSVPDCLLSACHSSLAILSSCCHTTVTSRCCGHIQCISMTGRMGNTLDWWFFYLEGSHCISSPGSISTVHQMFDIEGMYMQVEVDAQDRGALRLAREATPDVLLCEELKHLSTALTRAKNNVVVFDSSVKQSTPFFNYLHRLGLAQSVSMSALLPPTTTAFTYPEVQRSSCTHKHPRLGYSQHTAYRTADLSVTTTLQQS